MTLTVGSLFSGIGGIDLGLERAGMTVKWQSEIDPYASQVLKKHWPDIPNLGDITKIDWEKTKHVDVIAGGYPCQPFSISGLRQGENDPRHLWPYFRNAIGAIRPRFALLENVRGHLTMGGTTVIGDLAKIGYDCEWQLVPAAGVGAPHRRDRLIIVAYPHSLGRQKGRTERPLQLSTPGDPYRCSWWCTEPDVGRMANGVPRRVDRLKGLGNAVVPQVAEYVGRLILQSLN